MISEAHTLWTMAEISTVILDNMIAVIKVIAAIIHLPISLKPGKDRKNSVSGLKIM